MKRSIVLSVALTMLNAMPISANESTQNYKCYVEYVGGGDGIQLIQVTSTETSNIDGFLKARPVSDIKQSSKVWVLNVKECVKQSESFRLGRAQVLDRETPR